MDTEETVIEEVKPDPVISEVPVTVTPEDFKKLQDALKSANKESAARRKQLEAFEKADADRKLAELSDIEKANTLLSEEQKKRQEAEAKLTTLHLEKEFDKAARTLQFEYANEQAAKDAFSYLTAKGVTTETMEDALKELSQERPYLMKTKVEKPEIDSKEKGMKLQGEMTEARRKELTQRIPSLR
jgi:hypothetical protein